MTCVDRMRIADVWHATYTDLRAPLSSSSGQAQVVLRVISVGMLSAKARQFLDFNGRRSMR